MVGVQGTDTAEGQRGTPQTSQQPRAAIMQSWFRSATKNNLIKDKNQSIKCIWGAASSPENKARRCLGREAEKDACFWSAALRPGTGKYAWGRTPFPVKSHRSQSAVHRLWYLCSTTIVGDTGVRTCLLLSDQSVVTELAYAEDRSPAWHLTHLMALPMNLMLFSYLRGLHISVYTLCPNMRWPLINIPWKPLQEGFISLPLLWWLLRFFSLS